MRHLSRFEPISVEQFLRMEPGDDRKYELDNGVVRMLAGAVVAHAWISGNIVFRVGQRLRGTGMRIYGSGFALRTSDTCVRMPDACVYREGCDIGHEHDQLLPNPLVLFEIRAIDSPRAETDARLAEYRRLASMETIVFVDPLAERTRVVQRFGPESWCDDLFAEPRDIDLPALGFTLPHAQLFSRD